MEKGFVGRRDVKATGGNSLPFLCVFLTSYTIVFLHTVNTYNLQALSNFVLADLCYLYLYMTVRSKRQLPKEEYIYAHSNVGNYH